MIEVIETCTGKYSASLSGLSACDPQRNYMGANSQVRLQKGYSIQVTLAAGIEPAISYLGNKRLIHWATRAMGIGYSEHIQTR